MLFLPIGEAIYFFEKARRKLKNYELRHNQGGLGPLQGREYMAELDMLTLACSYRLSELFGLDQSKQSGI